jgi:hypothetical protein
MFAAAVGHRSSRATPSLRDAPQRQSMETTGRETIYRNRNAVQLNPATSPGNLPIAPIDSMRCADFGRGPASVLIYRLGYATALLLFQAQDIRREIGCFRRTAGRVQHVRVDLLNHVFQPSGRCCRARGDGGERGRVGPPADPSGGDNVALATIRRGKPLPGRHVAPRHLRVGGCDDGRHCGDDGEGMDQPVHCILCVIKGRRWPPIRWHHFS